MHAPNSHYYWSRGNGWMEAGTAEFFTFAMVTGAKNEWLDGNTCGPAARKASLALVKHIDDNGNVGDIHGQAPIL